MKNFLYFEMPLLKLNSQLKIFIEKKKVKNF